MSEANSREIWAYRMRGAALEEPRRVHAFAEGELDGLRVDADGRIDVARPGTGRIAVVAPDGTLVREVALTGRRPTNLTFGGEDGRTVFVTRADGR